MSNQFAQSKLSEARAFASAAAYDVQKIEERTIESSALHNLQDAVDSLIQVVDALLSDEDQLESSIDTPDDLADDI